MSAARRQRGRTSELLVAKYLKANGWIYAEPTSSSAKGPDITGVVGVDFEIKARAGFPVKEAMKQQMKRHKEGIMPIAILRQNGQGESDMDSWPAVMPFSVLVKLLKEAGYQ